MKNIVFKNEKYVIQRVDNANIRELAEFVVKENVKLLGIETICLGEPVEYLHSETVPVYSERKGLMNFYNKNSNILKM